MKHRLNTVIRNRVFSLSTNEVGGEGRGEVARKTQSPSPCPSPRLGGAKGKASCISKFIRAYPSRIAGSAVKK
jgi:hypothetical protein